MKLLTAKLRIKKSITEYISTGKSMGNLAIVGICEMYGWTYQEYMSQPTWFIDLIIEKMKIDAKKAKNKT